MTDITPTAEATEPGPAAHARGHAPGPLFSDGGAIAQIPFGQLVEWPHNPRKSRAPAAVPDMADSIAANGMLHNLVVRELTAETYQVLIGETRRRAFAFLVDQNMRVAADPIPCRVVEANDLQALTLAMAENLDRADMHPLDEAAAFGEMIKLGANTASIAAGCTRSRRWVQDRLAFVEKLSAKVQAKFRDGAINGRQARALTMGTPDKQDALLLDIERGNLTDPRGIKDLLAREGYPLDYALFTVEEYTAAGGTMLSDPDDPGDQFFGDEKLFRKMQKSCVKAKKAELDAKFSFVHVIGETEDAQGYEACDDPAHAGAIIKLFADGQVDIREGVAKVTTPAGAVRGGEADAAAGRPGSAGRAPAPARGTKGKAPAPAKHTIEHLVYSHAVKTAALQTAVAGDPRMATIFACLGLLGARGFTKITTSHLEPTDPRELPDAVVDGLKPLRGALKKAKALAPYAHAKGGVALDYGHDDDEPTSLAAYKYLAGLDKDGLADCFASIVTGFVGSYPGFDPALGDHPVIGQAAVDMALDHNKTWDIDESYLKTARAQRLKELVVAHGLQDMIPGADKMSRADLAAAFAEMTTPVTPAEMQFGAKQAIARQLKKEFEAWQKAATPLATTGAAPKKAAGSKNKKAAQAKAKPKAKKPRAAKPTAPMA